MNKGQCTRALLGMAFASAALFLSTDAKAGVSNPDYYFVDISAGAVARVHAAGRITNITGQLEGDLAADGSFAYNASSFNAHATSVAGVSARLIVGASGTSGHIDPSNQEVALTLRARVKFEGPLVPTACQTGPFTVTVSTHKWSTVWGTMTMSPLVGTFEAVAEDFTIPQLTATACGAALANDINTTLGFGLPAGDLAMLLQGSITNPSIPQP